MFKRTTEDFVCEHCNAEVKGDGYTNHCPKCLWSKHVDIHPGDRAEACGGPMKPIALEGASPHYAIVHRCERCGILKRNGAGEDDSSEALLDIARNR